MELEEEIAAEREWGPVPYPMRNLTLDNTADGLIKALHTAIVAGEDDISALDSCMLPAWQDVTVDTPLARIMTD